MVSDVDGTVPTEADVVQPLHASYEFELSSLLVDLGSHCAAHIDL